MRRISKRAIALILALLVLLAIAAGLLWLKLFVVRNVVIEGATDISQEEIIREATPRSWVTRIMLMESLSRNSSSSLMI